MLDYKHLEALATVVEEGGFEKAGMRLHISQSAVSQRIRQLEEDCGQILLIRETPPRPTENGQKFLKHFFKVALLESSLLSQDSGEKGVSLLKIALNADSLATWFLPAITPLVKKFGILFSLTAEDQDVTYRRLRNGDVMGCITTSKETLQGCKCQYLGQMNYILTASPHFKASWFSQGITLKSLQQAPAVTFDKADALIDKLLKKILGAQAPHIYPTHYVPSSEKFAFVLAQGWGYGSLPLIQAQEYLDRGELVDLAPGVVQEVHLYWHCWNIESELLQAVTQCLMKYFKASSCCF